MKSAIRASGLCGSMLVLVLAGSFLVAQETKKPDPKAPAAKAAPNRLPANYGKLDLADDQKDKIYAIQSVYDPKIDALLAQIEALKDKQEAEIDAILKPAQLKKLAEIRAEKKKAQEAKAAAEKAAATAAPAKTATPERK